MHNQVIIAVSVFAVVYAAITTEKVNKTAAALLGAMLMIVAGIFNQERAFQYVDWNVIFLLIGMMVLTGITRRTGLFQYLAIRLAKLARGEPLAILILLALATAVISAFLDNVTTVLILVPITFLIAVELDVTPVPFVIVLAIASNVGGTATLIGDPPNIMIGSAAGLGFMDFLANTAPAVLILLVALVAYVRVVFGKRLHVSNERKARIMAFDESKSIEDRPLLVKALLVMGLVILAFLFHGPLRLEPATIAMAGAALLLVVTRFEDVESLFGEIEWTTIMFFLGLFILVGALVEVGIMTRLSAMVLGATEGHLKITTQVVLWASAFLSAFVDNIPFVATMIPLIRNLGQSLGSETIMPLWWALSLGACLGGNGTLIGASANVVSAGIARKNGYPVTFWEFTKYGAPFTFLSMALLSVYMLIRY